MNKCITSLALVVLAVVGLAAFQNNPTIDILRFRGGPTLRTGAADPESSVTASPGSVFMRTNGQVYRKDAGSGTTGWVDFFDIKKRRAWVNFWPGNQTPVSAGLGTISTVGAMGDGSSPDYQMTRFTSAATAGSMSGPRLNVSIPHFRTLFDPTFYARIRTGSDITSLRIIIGFDTAAATNSDGDSRSLVVFRYSTVAGDTNWMGVCNNGGAATTQTADTGVAVAASTVYLFKVVISGDGTLATFTVNGSAPVTLNTNLPATSTGMFPTFSFTPQAASARVLDYSFIHIEWD